MMEDKPVYPEDYNGTWVDGKSMFNLLPIENPREYLLNIFEEEIRYCDNVRKTGIRERFPIDRPTNCREILRDGTWQFLDGIYNFKPYLKQYLCLRHLTCTEYVFYWAPNDELLNKLTRGTEIMWLAEIIEVREIDINKFRGVMYNEQTNTINKTT